MVLRMFPRPGTPLLSDIHRPVATPNAPLLISAFGISVGSDPAIFGAGGRCLERPENLRRDSRQRAAWIGLGTWGCIKTNLAIIGGNEHPFTSYLG